MAAEPIFEVRFKNDHGLEETLTAAELVHNDHSDIEYSLTTRYRQLDDSKKEHIIIHGHRGRTLCPQFNPLLCTYPRDRIIRYLLDRWDRKYVTHYEVKNLY